MASSGPKNFLAFDLGATSGRAILGRLDGGLIKLEELHRFSNDPVQYNGEMHWDAPRLWFEIRRGLDITRRQAERVDSIGVDTWGVDYGLLGENGSLIENPYHYRDARTDGMVEEVTSKVGAERIYEQTGIQFMALNTLYQLYAASQRTPNLLYNAEFLVTMPDLLNFWLTGVVACEYTIASTTQFLDWRTRGWSCDLLQKLEIPTHFLGPIIQPGTEIGRLRPDLGSAHDLAFTTVIAPACHDTGSAVAAVEAGGTTAFLSSGTWSLLGTEVASAVVTEQARRLNFTNEGGVGNTIRLLKNITGMWLLEGCRNAWTAAGDQYSYPQLLEAAAEAPPLKRWIDPDSPAFVRPSDMTRAIRNFCKQTDQPEPATPGEYTRTVIESLAMKYRYELEQLETLTGTRFQEVRVIGGGSQNTMLNQFTADATGKRVVAGPSEATALGNIVMQMVGRGVVDSIAEAREIVSRSFPPATFEPQPQANWDAVYDDFSHYCRNSAH
ncbi:MAG TPA: rhamnulokinase family protein [Bryobacteraceae bacterium]|jgi:rhamnulokinase